MVDSAKSTEQPLAAATGYRIIGNVQPHFERVSALLPTSIKTYGGLVALFFSQIGEKLVIEVPSDDTVNRTRALTNLADGVLELAAAQFNYPRILIAHELVAPGEYSQVLLRPTHVGSEGVVLANNNWDMTPNITLPDANNTSDFPGKLQHGDVFLVAPGSTLQTTVNDSSRPVSLLQCIVTG